MSQAQHLVPAAQGARGDDADAGVDLARLCATFGADPFITAFAQSLGEPPARSPGGAGANPGPIPCS